MAKEKQIEIDLTGNDADNPNSDEFVSLNVTVLPKRKLADRKANSDNYIERQKCTKSTEPLEEEKVARRCSTPLLNKVEVNTDEPSWRCPTPTPTKTSKIGDKASKGVKNEKRPTPKEN